MTGTTPHQDADDATGLRPGPSPAEASCAGTWVLRAIPQLERRLAAQPLPGEGELVIDAAAVTAMDTSGA